MGAADAAVWIFVCAQREWQPASSSHVATAAGGASRSRLLCPDCTCFCRSKSSPSRPHSTSTVLLPSADCGGRHRRACR